MLIIKNTIKDQQGNTLSELELFERDFRKIVLAVPEDESLEIHRTTILNDDGTETTTEERNIRNNATGAIEPPLIEGGGGYDGIF